MTLRELRVKNKLSQQAIADCCGVHKMTYLNWENHRNMPTEDNYQSLIEVLGQKPDDIIPKDVGRPIC